MYPLNQKNCMCFYNNLNILFIWKDNVESTKRFKDKFIWKKYSLSDCHYLCLNSGPSKEKYYGNTIL